MIGKHTAAPKWITGLLLCGALGVSACAPARPPTVALSQAEAVEQARENRASQYALEDLQLAREKLTSARLALDAREYERAHRLADQAVADAQLAEARADTESMRQTARDVRLSSETVRDTAAQASVTSLPPSPSAELRLARETLDNARLALDARAYERAHRLADQAVADARLAEARGDTESMRQTARDVRLSSETVRDMAVRASTTPEYLPPIMPLELRSAREELDSARLALDAREYERAHRLATQALMDARVAEARAETESVRRSARDARLSSETLRDTAARLAALY